MVISLTSNVGQCGRKNQGQNNEEDGDTSPRALFGKRRHVTVRVREPGVVPQGVLGR